MTALYITAGILLLLAALLLVRVQVGVSYIGDLRVELRLGPLRLDLKVNVACEDPAQTAALYGLISGQAAVLTRAVLALRHSKRRGDVYCEVTPDFLSESFDFMIDAAFGLRVWQGAALGITALRGFLKIRKSGKKEDDANEQRASTQADH